LSRVAPVTRSLASIDVPILMYHDVVVGDVADRSAAFAVTLPRFRGQLDYLEAKQFSVLDFAQLMEILAGRARRPSKAVLLTFDDGYRSFAQFVVPELLRRNMKATVFLLPNAIGGENDWDADTGKPLSPLMDEAEVRGVIAAGMDIGAHGLNHRDLNTCSREEAEGEIAESKQALVRRFGVSPKVFAYPFGRYNTTLFPLLEKSGYVAAVSIFSDQRSVTEQPFAMRRIYVHEADGTVRFSLKLSPLYARVVAWRDRRRGDECH
jgi:peptidoglycan/xylan/chitin deacetylase (PgdA/CDA1 family)